MAGRLFPASARGRALAFAGVLVLVALAGALAVDALWPALLPAAALLAFGVAPRPRQAGGAVLRNAGGLLALASLGLVFLAVAGIYLDWARHFEPAWLGRAVSWAGLLFLAGTLIYGLAAAKALASQRRISILFAFSLPAGWALDQGLSKVTGLFLSGFGLYLGLGIFGLSLIYIGRAVD